MCEYKVTIFSSIDMVNKPVKEVLGDNIISAQLNSHGISIKKNKDPSPVVCNSVPQNLHHLCKIMS